MRTHLIAGLTLVLAGCSPTKPDAAKADTESKAQKEPVHLSMETIPRSAAPTAAPPPPSTTAPTNQVAVPANPVLKSFQENADGTSVSELQALQRVAEDYNRARPSSVLEEGQKEWPELSPGMSELVTYHLLKQLPTPPPGKRYVYDPKTGKVSLQ